jgi:hypothetical protein
LVVVGAAMVRCQDGQVVASTTQAVCPILLWEIVWSAELGVKMLLQYHASALHAFDRFLQLLMASGRSRPCTYWRTSILNRASVVYIARLAGLQSHGHEN